MWVKYVHLIHVNSEIWMNILLISSLLQTLLCEILRFLLVNIGKQVSWEKVRHMVFCPLTYSARSAQWTKHVECGMIGILNDTAFSPDFQKIKCNLNDTLTFTQFKTVAENLCLTIYNLPVVVHQAVFCITSTPLQIAQWQTVKYKWWANEKIPCC